MRHKWEYSVDCFTFMAKNPTLKCKKCGIEARESEVRHGGLGPCKGKEN